MSVPFGPQLIGEAEKTLNALLHRFLEGTGLTEPQWVTLRLADSLDGGAGPHGLAAAIADRAQFRDADGLVRELTERGLLANGQLTSAGRRLTTTIQSTITTHTAAIWADLPAADVAAATRVLNEVVSRARGVLGHASCPRL